MATVCAIIAEYNPFHNGHAYHLRKAREASGADYMAVMMSGCFTQRGEPAIFSPYARSEMAMLGGADIVMTNPVTVSVREADSYAEHNVALLNRVPFVTHLAFGAECENLELLKEIARILDSHNPELDVQIEKRLNSYTCSHAGALSGALEDLYGIPHDITASPNNILGICYLRALKKTNSHLKPVLVQRKKSYHARNVDSDYPSASALRNAILRGDWPTVRRAVPPDVFELMQNCAKLGEISRPENFDTMLRYRLCTISKEEFWSLPDVYEGIENYIFKSNPAGATRKQMLARFSNKRYSQARVSRLLCHMVLRTSVEIWQQTPRHIHLLGFRRNLGSLLKQIENGRLDVISKRTAEQNSELLHFDRMADELWNITTNGDRLMSQMRKTIILD